MKTAKSIPSADQDDSFMHHDEQMILNLLSVIEGEPDTTQKDLATRLGVAVGVVNSYLKRVIYKGYVKTKSLQRRRLRYLLTPSGIKEKSRLTYEFLQYSYIYIREIRRKTREALTPLAKLGKKRIVFYGSGEVAELAYLAIRELGLSLQAVVDPLRVNEPCVDHVIQSLDWLEQSGDADAILLLKAAQENDDDLIRLKKIAEEKKMELIACV